MRHSKYLGLIHIVDVCVMANEVRLAIKSCVQFLLSVISSAVGCFHPEVGMLVCLKVNYVQPINKET